MLRLCGVSGIAVLLLGAPLVCAGQSFDAALPRTPEGVRLTNVAFFSGYSSSAYAPTGPAQPPSLGVGSLGSDLNYGASAELGWQRFRTRTNVAVRYFITYGGSKNYSGLNALNQSLSVSLNRALNSKWSVSFAGSGQDNNQAQFLFEPGPLATISQAATSFDDLAAAFSVGQFSNAQMAAILTEAPLLQSPGRNYILGNRILSYSLQASLNYAYSSRLHFHFSSVSAAGQHLSQDGAPETAGVMPRSLGLNAGAGFSYSISPRTDFGISTEENRTYNPFQHTSGTTVSASMGRKMGMHWFLEGHGGGAFTQFDQIKLAPPKTKQFVGGGSLGFRTYAHTFAGSYHRTASDTYGFAVGTTTAISGAWTWHRPSSRWNMSTTFSQQQVRNTGFTSLSGWEAGTSLSESLSSGLSLVAQYVYFSRTGTYAGQLDEMGIHSVRMSLIWEPRPVIR